MTPLSFRRKLISVDAIPASMTGPITSKKDATTVHILEFGPGNCAVMTALTGSVSYALIPQTTNEIRFSISRADSNCAAPVTAPLIKLQPKLHRPIRHFGILAFLCPQKAVSRNSLIQMLLHLIALGVAATSIYFGLLHGT
jgi:hypothetical protein